MTKSTTAAVSFVAALGSLVAKGTGNALGPLVTALRAFVSDKSSSDTTTATAAANATATGLCSLVGEHAGARAGSLVSASRGHIFRFRVHDILADDLPLELRYSGMRMEGCLVCSSTEKREARSEKREARSEKREARNEKTFSHDELLEDYEFRHERIVTASFDEILKQENKKFYYASL